MNLAQVARLLSGFAMFFSLALTVPLLVAIFHDEPPAPGVSETIHATVGLTAGLIFGLLASLALWLIGRNGEAEFFRREGLAVVGLAWLIAGGVGAIPFQWSGALLDSSDALFESVSGLTTTGASVFGTGGNPSVEDLPHSLLLYRSILQWMGGLGIILVFVVLLPAMGVTGRNLLDSEQVGVAKDNLKPRMHEQARSLFRLYFLLTVAAALMLWLVAGTSGFDALCHALTTLPSGGFSTKNASVGTFDSLAVELVLILFMFLAGANFTLMLATLRHRFQGELTIFKTSEFKFYVAATMVVVTFITMMLWVHGEVVPDPTAGVKDYGNLWQCLRDASFNAVSLMTSTGFSTANLNGWPSPVLVILLLCMLTGGCSGSTAGGVKMIRLLVSIKLISYTLRMFVRPKSVERIKIDKGPLKARVVSAIMALIMLWLACVFVCAIILSLDPRLDLFTAISASFSMLGGTGPSLCTTVQTGAESAVDLGPYGGYGALTPWAKWFMSMMMVFGRLEILAPIVLFAPRLWRK